MCSPKDAGTVFIYFTIFDLPCFVDSLTYWWMFGLFSFGATLCKAAINISLQLFVETYVSFLLGKYLEMGSLDYLIHV